MTQLLFFDVYLYTKLLSNPHFLVQRELKVLPSHPFQHSKADYQ